MFVCFYILLAAFCCNAQFPNPQFMQKGTTRVMLASDFQFASPEQTNPTLQFILDSYIPDPLTYAIDTQPVDSSAPVLHQASLVIENITSEELSVFDMDESYTIYVTVSSGAAAATINAENVFGALRGMQTFLQLGMSGLTDVYIWDFPRFPYRGFMLDTGRNFYDVDVILSILRLATWGKLNVFHWHLTDAQFTPITSTSRPLISEGAESSSKVYTQSDATKIKEWARLHGITVVTELDMPGHSYAWGIGYPDVLPKNYEDDAYCEWSECSAHGISCYVGVSTASNLTYEVLFEILMERSAQAEFFHMGGDEIETGCLWQDPSVIAQIDELSPEYYSMIDGPLWYFFGRYHDMITNAEIRNHIVWDDVFQMYPMIDETDNVLPSDYIVQVWGGNGYSDDPKPIVFSALDRGYRVISSPSNVWYFAGGGNPGWERYWAEEPTCSDTVCLSYSESKSLIGGEGCLWETTQDELWWGLYWNAFLIGERLWSPQNTTNQTDAEIRFEVSIRSFVVDFYNDTIQPDLISFSCSSYQSVTPIDKATTNASPIFLMFIVVVFVNFM